MFKSFSVLRSLCGCCDRGAVEREEEDGHRKTRDGMDVSLVDARMLDAAGSMAQKDLFCGGQGDGPGRTKNRLVGIDGTRTDSTRGVGVKGFDVVSVAYAGEERNLAPDKIEVLKYLLPFKHDTRPTLVLDLDQTLVYSTFEMPRCYDFDIRVPGMGSVIYVKLRPHMARFIETIGASYEIVVFTAAKKEYAQRVVGEIDRNRHIKHILYRDSCTLFNGKYIKDLSRLGRPLSDVILVDDIPYSYKLQPRNGVHIPPYTGEDNDDALLELMEFLRRLPKGESLCDHIVQAPFKADVAR